MLLYAITSRVLLAPREAERTGRLLALVQAWAAAGIDFIQLREKDLLPAELARLAADVVRAVRQTGSPARVLINGPLALAAAVARQSGADGVHLPGGLSPAQLAAAVRQLNQAWQPDSNPAQPRPNQAPRRATDPAISISCHSPAEVSAARAAAATVALFAPVFEKPIPGAPPVPGLGLELLAEACSAGSQTPSEPQLPVLALGGVNLANAPRCLSAGVVGIAAIRLFLPAESAKWPRLRLL